MIQRFKLEGFYKYINVPNGKGDLTGEIEVAEDGSFESQIYDHASMVPEQFIKGYLKSKEGFDKLSFLKFPPKMNLANLAYNLIKKSNESLAGKYLGEWGALPIKTQFNKDYGLFIAQIDMIDICGIGDSAEINLYNVN